MARVGAMITEPAQSEPPSVTKPTAKQPVGQLTSDVGHSIRNALKLGMGLLGSWAVALLIRLALPRFLGISPRVMNYKIQKYQITNPRWTKNKVPVVA